MSKRFGRNQKRRMREALLAGEELRKAGLQTIGIDFVPVPVLSDEDKSILVRDVQMRLAQIENESEVNNG